METGKLYIKENENGKINIIFVPVNNAVWLTRSQIATLLGCYTTTVSNHVRAIFKLGVFREDEVSYCVHYANGNGVDMYNLEMITALAFRIHSRNAEVFWLWLMKRVYFK
ncbi:hypothetical protein EZS27_006159 [termite gut metagenome]|uniref:Bro-N domain-containing protein n=1 Tax=termite gut metagenome TaxID=433724 RepID=A0A5J4SJZ4_9ZZZZ